MVMNEERIGTTETDARDLNCRTGEGSITTGNLVLS